MYEDTLCFLTPSPVQALTASVTVGLELPFQSDLASGANIESIVIPEDTHLDDLHGGAVVRWNDMLSSFGSAFFLDCPFHAASLPASMA